MGALVGRLLPFYMALVLWPLTVITVILCLMVVSLRAYVPSIWRTYGWRTWLWKGLAASLICLAAGTYLVMTGPPSSNLPSMAISPRATIGLLLSSWSLFGWVLASELTARLERQRQERLMETGESLEAHLNQAW